MFFLHILGTTEIDMSNEDAVAAALLDFSWHQLHHPVSYLVIGNIVSCHDSIRRVLRLRAIDVTFVYIVQF